MNRVQKLGKIAILAFAIVGFVACNTNDGEVSFEVVGDVFVIKKMDADDIVYGSSYYAYGNKAMTEAIVTNDNNEEIELGQIEESPYTYGLKEEFSLELPEGGSFKFEVVQEGISYEDVDELLFEDIDLPLIADAKVENQILEIEWEAGLNDEYHTIRILNEDDELIYVSDLLASQVEELLVDPSKESENWATGYPNVGDTYTMELHGVLFEENANNSNYLYNLQEIAISKTEIEWQ